mmetsp:Transcript_73752/g.171044  ORF Transcript_73752/g.171044 Transcript_73752/m.171044 type:complete len:495 (-) Transcript_73752:60-1544(-)
MHAFRSSATVLFTLICVDTPHVDAAKGSSALEDVQLGLADPTALVQLLQVVHDVCCDGNATAKQVKDCDCGKHSAVNTKRISALAGLEPLSLLRGGSLAYAVSGLAKAAVAYIVVLIIVGLAFVSLVVWACIPRRAGEGASSGDPLAGAPVTEPGDVQTPTALLEPLTDKGKGRLQMAVDSVASRVLNWTAAPDVWWDQTKRLEVAGLGELIVRRKHHPYKEEPINASVVMGTVVFEGFSIPELMQMTAVFEGSPREKYDTTIKRFQVLQSFENDLGEELKITRSQSHPIAMGIISGREVDFVGKTCWLPDGRALECGASLNSLVVSQHLEGCANMEELRDAPPSAGLVKAYVHAGALLFELLEEKDGVGSQEPAAPTVNEEVPKSPQPKATDESPPRRRCFPVGKVCHPCLPARAQRRPLPAQPPPAIAAGSAEAPVTEGRAKKGRVRFCYIVSAEAGGHVPRWALDLALTGTVQDFIKALNCALQASSSSKA